MHKLTWIILLLLGLLHFPGAFAGDAPMHVASAAALDGLMQTSRDMHFTGLTEQDTLSPSSRSPLSDVEFKFQDMSALGRIRNLRSFSLLTLAETERSRFFLGMNKRGLFGLHFGYVSHDADNRSLELLRMPYLESTTPEKTTRN